MPARDLASEPGDGGLRVHLGDHSIDILGVDAGFHLPEKLDQGLTVGSVGVCVGGKSEGRRQENEEEEEGAQQLAYRPHGISIHPAPAKAGF